MPARPPNTRHSLILRLQDQADVDAWDEFVEVYGPVVYRSARRFGLQRADADDCVQECLSAVAESIADWLRRDDRGPFRAWLFRIARNTAIDLLTRRKHRPLGKGGDTATEILGQLEAAPDVSSHFDLEYRREVFQRASLVVREQVTANSWDAFYQTSVLQREVQRVAEELNLSVGSVYIARSRVMKRLRQIVKSFEE